MKIKIYNSAGKGGQKLRIQNPNKRKTQEINIFKRLFKSLSTKKKETTEKS